MYDPNGKRYKGYPRKIGVGLIDTPSHLDAAFIWSYDEKPYFFKGTDYWQYSRWGMSNGWPKSTDDIFATLPERPKRIDAALKWTNNKSYVFVGDKYYRLSAWRTMKVFFCCIFLTTTNLLADCTRLPARCW